MNTLYMMVGISGSGKSTFAKSLAEIANIPRISSDEIRGELCNGDQTDQSKNGEVFRVFHERINKALNTGSVIADATSVKSRDRKELRQIALKCGARIVAIIMTTQPDDCKRHNATRDRNVPDWVIDKQFNAFTVPTLEEVSEIWYVDWQVGVISLQTQGNFPITPYRTIQEIYENQKV